MDGQKLDIPNDFLQLNLSNFEKNSIERLLNNKIQSIDNDIFVKQFEQIVNKGVNIPEKLITSNLVYKILKSRSLFENRILIENFSKNNDVELFNKCLKGIEQNMIDTGLISKYDTLLKELENFEYSENNRSEFVYIINETKFSSDVKDALRRAFPNRGKISEIIKNEINVELSDIIIDYHFNDISYNVFLDIKELLNFQLTNGVSIPVEHLKIYRDVLNIDKLSIKEKINLHNMLKEKNISEMFYDDYSSSRDKMYQEISNSILDKNKIEQFRDVWLSDKYWVTVYKFDGQDFFGLIRKSVYTNPKPWVVGSSFSLVWTDCIWVIGGDCGSRTFLYEWLKPEQIQHIYPSDSYTNLLYEAWSMKNSNNVARILKSPSDFLKATRDYNELLVFRDWTKQSGTYWNIWTLKPIALYCYDKITPRDIEVAKRENVGIMLINTDAYPWPRWKWYGYEMNHDMYYITSDFDYETFQPKQHRDKRTSFDRMDELNRVIK